MGDSHGLVGEKTATGSSMAPQSSRSTNGAPNGSLYLQASGSNGNVVLVRRLRRRDEGLWKPLARWFVENQVGTLVANIPRFCF